MGYHGHPGYTVYYIMEGMVSNTGVVEINGLGGIFLHRSGVLLGRKIRTTSMLASIKAS